MYLWAVWVKCSKHQIPVNLLLLNRLLRSSLSPTIFPTNSRRGHDLDGLRGTTTLESSSLCLVGGCTNPFEKYEFVNWDDYNQYMGK